MLNNSLKQYLNIKNDLLKVITVCLVCLFCFGCDISSINNQLIINNYCDNNDKNIGIYLDSPDEIIALERMPQFLCWFENWYGQLSLNKLSLCGENHIASVFITWQPNNIQLDEIASGIHDDYIKEFLYKITSYCNDDLVIIRFAHEMEMRPQYKERWYSWQGESPDVYIDAWCHVVSLSREINNNIKWLWSPNRSDEYSRIYYPGDEYVDYVGVTANIPLNEIFKYDDFEDYYINCLGKDDLEKYNKGIVISEIAYCDSDNKAMYMESIFNYYLKDEKIILVAFFNYDVSEDKQYMISDDKRYMKIFFDGIELLRNEK